MPHPLRSSSTHAFKHVLQEIDDSGLRVLAIASAKPGPKGLKAASIKRSVGCRRVPSKQKFAWLLQELPEMRALVSISHSQAFSSGHTSSRDHMQAHMKGGSCSRQKGCFCFGVAGDCRRLQTPRTWVWHVLRCSRVPCHISSVALSTPALHCIPFMNFQLHQSERARGCYRCVISC